MVVPYGSKGDQILDLECSCHQRVGVILFCVIFFGRRWGLPSWGEPTNPLLSALKLSAGEADFEVLNKFVILDLEYLLSKESLQRVGLRLLESESENFISYSNLFSLFLISQSVHRHEA